MWPHAEPSPRTVPPLCAAVKVSAATRALESVALGLLEEHLDHCVAQAIAEGGDTANEKIREASDAIARLVRS
jgi:CsoR family transcriptional regulator, copper-sensing transcriptional repressor